MELSTDLVNQTSPSQAKIALFRSLFRGRDDVYPRRFESRKTGKSGYAPACANEWVRGICEKPRIKCAECPNRRFLPVTDDVIRWHLSGHDADGQPFVAGVYPLLLDETCFFLAVDFDKAGWREDAAAFLDACRRLNLPAALERSRSGQGAHVWFFFEEAIPAALARRLGSHVLTETMEGRPDIGLDSYDRLFPNQDTMPQGGFGNLIALPLQKGPRKQGNSVFLDDAPRPVGRPVGVSRERAQDRPSAGRSGSSKTPNAAVASSACGCRHRTTETTSRGRPRRRGTARNHRSRANCRDVGAGPRQPDLHRQGRTAPGPAEPAASAGGVSEPRVLQGAGDAAVDLRQAARHRLRRGSPAAHRSARGCLDDVRQTLTDWASRGHSRRALRGPTARV